VSANTLLKILLVEDNQINQLMAQGTLSHLGHEVAVASDGSEAVELCKANRYDLILMDLMMPVMDGFEASRSILQHCREESIPPPTIIALTATLTDNDKSRCREHGMQQWLNKPIDLQEFQSVASTLGGAQETSPQHETPQNEPSTSIQADDLLSRIKDKDALQHIVELFCQSYPLRLAELRDSLSPGAHPMARRAAHTLKGNFLNFACKRGAEISHALEHAIEESRWPEAQESLVQLEEQCRNVERDLTELLKRPAKTENNPTEYRPGEGFSVIVADVDPANRAICAAALKAEGYEVTEAADGEQVLGLLENSDIDVVLMGVFMSHLGGFETCRRIKSNAETQMIPVLLVTALDERAARISGMDAGADEFITKPIDPREVSLRVRNAARGKELYDQLQSSFEELKRLEELRDGLTHMLVHDLRTPLTAIKGYAGLLVSGFGAGLSPQQQTFAEKIVIQSNRLVDMVSAILDVSRLESDQMPLKLEKTDLSLLLFEQGEQFSGLPDCHMHLDIADSIILACDSDLIKRVVANLLSNAFKYTPKDETVTLRLRAHDEFATVEVLDKGPGVPVELREKIFEKFAQVEGESHKRPYSSGLGLTFCQLVVQKHNGDIGVDEGPNGGSRFWLTLPLQQPPRKELE
jgi:two-component system, sensor histidine kinase and response regulator